MFPFASEKMVLFVGLWEGHAALSLGPFRKRLLNKGARGTAVASIAEAFGHGWTTSEC